MLTSLKFVIKIGIVSGNGLVENKPVTWINDDSILRRHLASLGYNELNKAKIRSDKTNLISSRMGKSNISQKASIYYMTISCTYMYMYIYTRTEYPNKIENKKNI